MDTAVVGGIDGSYLWMITEGVSEIELASMLDVYPGPVFTANTTTLTPEGPRSPVRSEHGLYFVPRSDFARAPGLDRVLVPGRTALRRQPSQRHKCVRG